MLVEATAWLTPIQIFFDLGVRGASGVKNLDVFRGRGEECVCVLWELKIEIMEMEEYCGDELHDLEVNGYAFQDTISEDTQGNPLDMVLEPGYVGEVHCGEEHHDHDHDDH